MSEFDDGAAFALQAAMLAALAADAGVRALIGDPPRVHDGPSKEKVFPFVSFDEARASPFGPAPGHVEHDIRLSVHSRYEGRREAKEIAAAVVGVLHHGEIAVSGRRLVSLRAVYSDIFHRPDSDAHQAILRFRAVTEKV